MARQKKASASGILALVNRIENVAITLEKLCKCVWGNGVPGIKDDVTTIKAQLEIMKWILSACVIGITIPVILKYVFKIGG
jgi:hypothetical protein